MKENIVETIRVDGAQWGLLPDTGQDATAALQRMLQECRAHTEIVLRAGRYDFFPEHAQRRQFALSNSDEEGARICALVMEEKRQVILDGNGATFVFHGQMMPLTVNRCRDVTIRNLTLDWDIPLSAEAVVVSACDSWADLQIDETMFPYAVREGTLFFCGENWQEPLWPAGHIEFDVDSRTVAYQRGDRFPQTRQQQMGAGCVRFWGDFSGRQPKAGNVVVLRHGRRLHAGIFINACENVTLEHTTLHASGGLGILAQFSKDLRFLDVSITPNRQRGRQFVCGHDDGIHLSNNRGSVRIERCCFQGLMDDPVNLHGTAARITRVVDAYTLEAAFMHPQSRGFPLWAKKGQRISFLRSRTLARLGQGIVSDYRLCTSERFLLTLKEPIAQNVRAGDALENSSNSASLICRNNHFGGCRARGLLLCTPKRVLVEGNFFESSGAEILIAGDASDWYESGGCEAVEICNNSFSDACLSSVYEGGNAVITVCPNVAQAYRETPYHRNISIHDNLFYSADAPVFFAKDAAKLAFRGNRVIRSYRYPPEKIQKSMFQFDTCTQVTLQNNAFVGQVLGKRIQISGMEASDLQQDMDFPVETM